MKASIEALKDSIQGTRSLTPIRLASPLNLQHFKGGVVADAALIAVDPCRGKG